MSLKDKRCVPCEGGTPPLDGQTVTLLLADVKGWELRVGSEAGARPKIAKHYKFADFLGSMAFIDKLAALAEEQGHHPDFCVHYNEVDVTLWTHAVGGLSENDFIMASKIDAYVA
jgi:4a-hydroxytetrahydrobiopterin dehydratase